jgi:hypothetical protein
MTAWRAVMSERAGYSESRKYMSRAEGIGMALAAMAFMMVDYEFIMTFQGIVKDNEKRI